MYKYLSEASWSLLCTALLPVSLDETRAPAALNENRIVTPSLFCRSACVRELTMFPSPQELLCEGRIKLKPRTTISALPRLFSE